MISASHIRTLHGRRTQSRPRRGVILVAVLVCLLIVVTMLGRMLQGVLRSHLQLRSERDLRQTELLLQAGTERAAVRLSRDSDYHGEIWSLPADSIVGTNAGQVTIKVNPFPSKQLLEVNVLAEYPSGRETSIRRSSTFTVPQPHNSK